MNRVLNPERLKIAAMALALAMLAACGGENATGQASNQPVAFESGEECHLCGMVITGFPGPKGELFEGRDNQVRKFCSTRDLMSWYLQPENKPNSRDLFVHDMSRNHWDSPNDEHLIKAEDAWYVAGSKMKGAMGPTLASFAHKEQAETFMSQHGGQLLAFKEITMDVLNMSSPMNMGAMGAEAVPTSTSAPMNHMHH